MAPTQLHLLTRDLLLVRLDALDLVATQHGVFLFKTLDTKLEKKNEKHHEKKRKMKRERRTEKENRNKIKRREDTWER